MKTIEPQLLVDSHHGIYIPKMFAEWYNLPENFKNYDEIKDDLFYLSNPDNKDIDSDNYDTVYTNVLDNAIMIDKDGNEMYLYHNEDLWSVPVGYENEDFFNN